ncbi:MAG: hypothetical protein HOP10_12690 [Chitinophagaceae bacterium]|nr:hypothetical protein [Chitinophagaceae bacterium]
MFLLILAISIITAIAQIISTSYDLKAPLQRGLSRITLAGWFFYICTGILAFMPAIQKAIQDSIDNNKEIEIAKSQEVRDARLRYSYDSSLVEMKKKFDTTTSIVSETLGKYGYKLDSSNKTLINLRDSVKGIAGGDPILELYMEDFEPIQLVEKLPNNKYKFKISITTHEVGCSNINIRYSFVVSDSFHIYYTKSDNSTPVEPTMVFSPIYRLDSYHNFSFENSNPSNLFLWINGTYKRLDGTGNFFINQVYAYYFTTKTVRLIRGETRKSVIAMIKQNEK